MYKLGRLAVQSPHHCIYTHINAIASNILIRNIFVLGEFGMVLHEFIYNMLKAKMGKALIYTYIIGFNLGSFLPSLSAFSFLQDTFVHRLFNKLSAVAASDMPNSASPALTISR